jgi:hypothetical protein
MSVLPASLMARWLRALALLALLGAGCQSFVASPAEYGAYRAVRVAPTLPEQLRAAWTYLARYPDGAFHADVSFWFAKVEPLYFESSADSAQGMQRYLDALPEGPHAAAAAQRRDALIGEQKGRAGEGIAKAAAEFEQRLAVAAQSREDVVSAYSSWVARLVDFDGFGRPLQQAFGEPFASNWSADPKPACVPNVCSKVEAFSYELEVEGSPQKFVCTFDIAVRANNKKNAVFEASVHGPLLFDRIAEAQSARLILPDDDVAREAAIGRIIELTSGAVARKLDPHKCSSPAKPPAVMALQCDPIRLEIIPGATESDDDRVVIRWLGKL